MVRLIKVLGDSLLPAYKEGDFVLVSKIPFLFGRPRPGDTVVFQHPQYGTMIKKVTAVNDATSQLTVQGTHPLSIDSRRFGPISKEDLTGLVLWHIKKPAER